MKNLKRGDTFIEVITKSNPHRGADKVSYTPKVYLVSSPMKEYGTLVEEEGHIRAFSDTLRLFMRATLSYSTLEEAQDTIDRWLEQEALGDLYTKKTTSYVEYPQGEDK